MIFVTFAYFLATLVIGVAQILQGATWEGSSFLFAGLFAYWGGSALKLAVFAPTARLRLVGLLMTAFFAVFGALATHVTGAHFEAFGHDLPGYAWVLVGVIAGIMGTRRRRYIAPPDESQV